MSKVLAGIRVLEFAGLAPGPYCGLILSDFGADVIRIDRPGKPHPSSNLLARGKRVIELDIKHPPHVDAIKQLICVSDVVIDPFRPGILEKVGLGPKEMLALNSKLVYARLTGYGATGPLSTAAGHDINYLAISGALSTIKRHGEKPLAPVNYLADFAGGGLLCAHGIVLALFERTKSGKGQVVDCAMLDGVNYMSAFLHKFRATPVWKKDEPGTNLLDSGAPFYDTYETADKKYVAVGAIEPAFYAALLEGLGLAKADLPDQMDQSEWPILREQFTARFKQKTRDEWTSIFEGVDACVTPVLSMDEAITNDHNQSRHLLQMVDGNVEVAPAPKLSRTPAVASTCYPVEPTTLQVLQDLGIPTSML